MRPTVYRVFRAEVKHQAKLAIMAAAEFQKALEEDDAERFWYALQAFLLAAGNLSKIFSPIRQLLPRRKSVLQAAFGVTDRSLLMSRRLRDHFERYDERMERWALSARRRDFAECCIGRRDLLQGIDCSDFMRWFDPETYTLILQGECYDLWPVINAVGDLLEYADESEPRERAPGHSDEEPNEDGASSQRAG